MKHNIVIIQYSDFCNAQYHILFTDLKLKLNSWSKQNLLNIVLLCFTRIFPTHPTHQQKRQTHQTTHPTQYLQQFAYHPYDVCLQLTLHEGWYHHKLTHGKTYKTVTHWSADVPNCSVQVGTQNLDPTSWYKIHPLANLKCD